MNGGDWCPSGKPLVLRGEELIVRYDGDFVVRGLVISCFFGALLSVGTNHLQAFMLNVNKIIVLRASLASECNVGF